MTTRNKRKSFRVGRVGVFLRGEVWYLRYYEHGRHRRPRVGPDRYAARQLAAQINAQLETGEPAALSFESISITELQ
jgi:predicted metal-dependent hydrolase